MDFSSPIFWVALLQIIWIDLLLSGDNAVVIALACRSLPEKQRKWGILLGAGAAVGLRIIFALVVSYMLGVPFLKVVGGLLLFWIAIKLVLDEGGEGHHVEGADSLWKAVRTITIPLIIFGSQLILKLISRFPILIWFGAALLGWIAGEMLVGDKVVLQAMQGWAPWLVEVIADPEDPVGLKASAVPHYLAAVVGAVFVVSFGWIVKSRRREATAH